MAHHWILALPVNILLVQSELFESLPPFLGLDAASPLLDPNLLVHVIHSVMDLSTLGSIIPAHR